MRYLTLAAMVRNEASYLPEWVKYHSALGFEEFYLFENDSTDATKFVLHALSQTYPIRWEIKRGKAIVRSVFEECIIRHRQDARWILFLDCDEFVVCHKDLHTFLKDYEPYSGLTVHWRIFGSAGERAGTAAPVVKRFTKRAAEVDLCCKTFVDPVRTSGCYTSHRFEHTSPPVDENFIPITTVIARTDTPTADKIQINHYATKSYTECMVRRAARRLATGTPHKSAEEYFAKFDKNEVEDLRAAAFWDSL